MEAIWNYFFWQTLSINMLDDTAHMLRASLTVAPDCMEWHNEPPKTPEDHEMFERCNSYLGPNQPGIFSPDPLDDGSNPSAAQPARRERQAGRRASASSAARASPRPARCPASPTSRSRRSCCRPPCRTCSTR